MLTRAMKRKITFWKKSSWKNTKRNIITQMIKKPFLKKLEWENQNMHQLQIGQETFSKEIMYLLSAKRKDLDDSIF